MTHPPSDPPNNLTSLHRLPRWVAPVRVETTEDASFVSGSALAYLHLLMQQDAAPNALLRARLALRAAEVRVTALGRPERMAALRDEIAFLRPQDQPGPAGEIYLSLRRATERPLSDQAIRRALPKEDPAQISGWMATGSLFGAKGPVARAAATIQSVLGDHPREHALAGLLGDAILARALGWDHLLPILSSGLKRTDFHKRDEDLRVACHRAVVGCATDAMQLAADLARRTARLRAVVPKLRARGADAAVELFLSRDVVPSTALVSLRSDRAARRLCDRLVSLDVVREVTGRETFRLYGV